jgi:hypothetical protein
MKRNTRTALCGGRCDKSTAVSGCGAETTTGGRFMSAKTVDCWGALAGRKRLPNDHIGGFEYAALAI